ncbi:MAG TPA: hypothetical protein VIF62_03590, partial [Labilithrix sp.]
AGIYDAGWSDADHGDNFFALLDDDTPFAMLDNLVNAPDATSSTPGGIVPPTMTPPIVPLGPNARLLFSLGNAFSDNRPALKSMLANAGYSVTTPDATLTMLYDAVKDDGYFYWASHAGYFDVQGTCGPNLTSCNKEIWMISTASEWSAAADATDLVKGLYAAHLITVAGASWDNIPNPVDTNKNGKIDPEEQITHKVVYAIQPAFIAQRFKLSEKSAVFQDSCTSAFHAFSDAYTSAGADLYVGWDKTTWMGPKMALFTDRMLGANTVAPIEAPPERPFPQDRVIAWMRAKNLDGSGSGSKLQVTANPDSGAGILAPSIQYLLVDEGFLQPDQSTLTFIGSFGPRDDGKYKREVFLGGKPLHISDGGDESTIIADLPDDDSAAGAAVVVIGGRISNEVPLSLYDVRMTWQFAGAGSLFIKQDLHYKLRMDVHKSRDDVGAAPVGRLEGFRLRKDSYGTYAASGTGTVGTCDYIWTGSGNVTIPAVPMGPSLLLAGVVDLASGTIQAFTPVSDGGPATETVTCDGNPPMDFVLSTAIGYDANPAASMDTSTYAVNGGVATLHKDNGTGTLVWMYAVPLFPPTDKTKD